MHQIAHTFPSFVARPSRRSALYGALALTLTLTATLTATLLAPRSAHAAPAASARPSFDVQLFRPSGDAGSVFDAQAAEMPPHLAVTSALWIDWARRPFHAEIHGDGALLGDIVGSRTDARFATGITFFRRLTLGLDAPYVLHQSGLNSPIIRAAAGIDTLKQSGFGDMRLTSKAGVWAQSGWRPGVALAMHVTLPTGNDAHLFGQGAAMTEGALLTSLSIGRHLTAVNVGYRHRSRPMHVINLSVGNEITCKWAYAYTMGRWRQMTPWALLMSVAGHTPAEAPFTVGDIGVESARNSLEGRLGMRYRFDVLGGIIDVVSGVGVGVLPGYGGALPRLMFGVSYLSSDPVGDGDADGVPNASDDCPGQPEDLDGFHDDDGCPDLDNDGDEVPDEDDDCPTEPEDYDGQDDLDGCPEPDLKDSDGDGVFDIYDLCPEQKEDIDNWLDTDGCADLDNDADGLPDLNDLCPDVPEDFDGMLDDDGCPDDDGGRATFVKRRKNRIDLRRPIRFQPGTEKLLRGAKAVLRQVADVIRIDSGIVAVTIDVYPKRRNEKSRRMAWQRAARIAEELRLLGYTGKVTHTAPRYHRGRAERVFIHLTLDKNAGIEMSLDAAAP